uniref:Uncharacterized protein n=1 Tax=Romanomermis culicivorax TaxID=13658 RepID=A0A915K7A7_ROMCU
VTRRYLELSTAKGRLSVLLSFSIKADSYFIWHPASEKSLSSDISSSKSSGNAASDEFFPCCNDTWRTNRVRPSLWWWVVGMMVPKVV